MRKLLLLFFIPLLFTSCNKYPDGPGLSFRSAEKRLTGKWRLSLISYNDTDVTATSDSSHFELYPFNIYSDWSQSYFISITHTDASIIASSPMTLNKKKTVLSFCLLPQAPYEAIARDIFTVVPPLSGPNDWKILRLKNDELWIKTNFDINNYELHFDLLTDFNDY